MYLRVPTEYYTNVFIVTIGLTIKRTKLFKLHIINKPSRKCHQWVASLPIYENHVICFPLIAHILIMS